MFQFDAAALPKLLLRKALIIVDFQQDFVSPHGALLVTLPKGFVDRTTQLARAFHQVGDVIWVNSKFEQLRPPYSEQLEGETSEYPDGKDMTADPEAFLSHERAKCLLSSKLGAELPQTVKEEAEKRDVVMGKSHYSAFEGTGLLRLLQARMTMEIFICGTLISSGVYATAVDAARHGMQITIVDDCCGYLNEKKQVKAIKALVALTGCGLTSSAHIMRQNDGNSAASHTASQKSIVASVDDEITQSMSAMTLSSSTILRDDTADVEKKHSAEHHVSESMANAGTLKTNNCLHSICEGDTDIIEDLLLPELEVGIFETLSKEVQWQHMSHQGGKVPRLVAVQGEIGRDGSVPIYRHPSDESPPLLPLSPTVLAIKAETEKHLGHSLNHVLIQFYRNGKDYISEHSDKTLDISRGSFIGVVSFGAQRTMVLRTKRTDKNPSCDGKPTANPRTVQRAPLPHNSLCRMGLKTNMKWLHSIKQDKRADKEKSQEERDYQGGRISLTFRQIGTFLNKEGNKIWGQGATGKSLEDAQDVINGQTEKSVEMLRAFGTENHSSNFDWDSHYGQGFDVLHLRSEPTFIASADPVVNMRIRLMLAEYDINWAIGKIATPKSLAGRPVDGKQVFTEDILVKYIDNDTNETEISGDLAIMLYLYTNYHYQQKKSIATPADLGRQFTLFQKALSLLTTWRRLEEDDSNNLADAVRPHLTTWTNCTNDRTCIGGERPNLADFAFWPVLHAVVLRCGHQTLAEHSSLSAYYESMKNRASTVKMSERLSQV